MKENQIKNQNTENLSNEINPNEPNITCKDGFCFLPSQDKDRFIDEKNVNLFDPV